MNDARLEELREFAGRVSDWNDDSPDDGAEALVGELLAEVDRLRAAPTQAEIRSLAASLILLTRALADEQGAHAETAANFAEYAKCKDRPEILEWLARAVMLRDQAVKTCERRTAERGAARSQSVKLARGVLAWRYLADYSLNSYGDPSAWDCYDWHGWKLDMNGSEQYFADEFTALACKAACVGVHGLAEEIVAR